MAGGGGGGKDPLSTFQRTLCIHASLIVKRHPTVGFCFCHNLREIKTTWKVTPLGDGNGKPDRVAVVLSRLQPTPRVGLSSEYG